MYNDIVIYYFSATTNTFRAIIEAADIFREKKIETTIIPIEEQRYYAWEADMIIVAFPVHMSTTLPFVWKFLENLPKAGGTHAFMIDTHNGTPSVAYQVREILERKGYIPRGLCELLMPNNIDFKPFDEKERENRLAKALPEAQKFAMDILEGKTDWPDTRTVSFLASFQNMTGIPLKAIRFFFCLRVDPEKCTNCGLCIEFCPVQNIRRGVRAHIIGDKCEFCCRCVTHCPVSAINTKGNKLFIKRAIE